MSILDTETEEQWVTTTQYLEAESEARPEAPEFLLWHFTQQRSVLILSWVNLYK